MKKEAYHLAAYNIGTVAEPNPPGVVLTLYGETKGDPAEIVTVVIHPDAAYQIADALLDAAAPREYRNSATGTRQSRRSKLTQAYLPSTRWMVPA